MAKSIITINPDSQEYRALVRQAIPTVYIIRCVDWYKIGFTRTSITSRVEAMQTGNPFPLKLVFAIQTERFKQLEDKLHYHFDNRPRFREWFKLEAEDEKKIEDFVTNFLYGNE